MITRDFFQILKSQTTLEAVLLWGPRQVGKSTLLQLLEPVSEVTLDDLEWRRQAQTDPAFLLDQQRLPCLIDEVQYAPQLFSEIKLRIDSGRRADLKAGRLPQASAQYFLTGSNRTLLEASTRESLAGRCSIFELHGLSVAELVRYEPAIRLSTLMLRGGFPELYRRPELRPVSYLNDYISTFIEKDIGRSSGIEKIDAFLTLLRLLATRVGQFINFSDLAQLTGVDVKTVQSWVNVLQRNFVVQLVLPWSSNLSKRITKMPKLHFYDVALCARLQGHQDEDLLMASPQAGAMFESMVFSELAKTRANFCLDWQIWTWRTKERNEIDFILQTTTSIFLIEVKLGIQSAKSFSLDTEGQKVFGDHCKQVVVTAGGATAALDNKTWRVPIQELGAWLRSQTASAPSGY